MSETKTPKANDATPPLYRVAFVYTSAEGYLRNSQYVVPANSIADAESIVALKLAQRFAGTNVYFRIGTIKLF